MIGTVEIRREGDGPPTLHGRFPYGTMATMKNRGTVRKESFRSRAFRFSISQETEREINLLVGHDYQRPLASRRAGSLTIRDGDDAVTFEATLPAAAEQPTWMRDALLSVRAGLMTGVSPGFIVPPRNVVPGAEKLIPEPGNAAVMIREIREAVLMEMSLVTRPTYPQTDVEARAWHEIRTGYAFENGQLGRFDEHRRRIWL